MTRYRDTAISLVSVVLIAALVVGEVDRRTKAEHAIAEMRSFIAQGPRFTAIAGDRLCRDIQQIQKHLGLEAEDCQEITNPTDCNG